MNIQLAMALISLAGTGLGTFGGILTSAKLTSYRLEQLEKKVDKHNSFAERIPVLEQKQKVSEHRIEDLERKFEK